MDRAPYFRNACQDHINNETVMSLENPVITCPAMRGMHGGKNINWFFHSVTLNNTRTGSNAMIIVLPIWNKTFQLKISNYCHLADLKKIRPIKRMIAN